MIDVIYLFASVFIIIFSLEVVLVFFLSFISKLGKIGQSISKSLTKAPWLDVIISLLIWIPWLIGFWLSGGIGLISSIVAQIMVMQLWVLVHELVNQDSTSSPRIFRFLDQKVGWWRNRIALWSTTIALPAFFLIRFSELTVYPILIWALNFPSYKHSDWVTVSRHKFKGLVGHDLIWCLYCDWMTGVYSLGAEMLRNLESFWCPIRFDDSKKCENCKLDFPDLEVGWIAPEGTMEDVEKLLKKMYGNTYSSWFGHPERQK